MNTTCINNNCRRSIPIGPEGIGRQLVCPGCKQWFKVPHPEANTVTLTSDELVQLASLLATATGGVPFQRPHANTAAAIVTELHVHARRSFSKFFPHS